MNPTLQQYLSSVEEREDRIHRSDSLSIVAQAHLLKFDIPLQSAIIRKLAEVLEDAWIMLDAANRRTSVEVQRDHLDAELQALITQATKP